MRRTLAHDKGFTLVELSIVLVIIGLIVGGVLAGQDLIRAAAVRAQISQIEKYQTAVHAFQDKYSALPGDMNAAAASNFGFAARGPYAGEGDGNGVIEGNNGNLLGGNLGILQITGETSLFWVDLSNARLIDGTFTSASATGYPSVAGPLNLSSTPSVDSYFPQAKLGKSNYVYVWSGGWGGGTTQADGKNYFGVAANLTLNINCPTCLDSSLGMTVNEAYSIDKKMDDGLPQSGAVTTLFLGDMMPYWAGTNIPNSPPFTWGYALDPTHGCTDNGGIDGTPQQYSLPTNADKMNCALSFQFQ